MAANWVYTSLTEEQNKQRDLMSEELGISSILCQLLVRRGITTVEAAKKLKILLWDRGYLESMLEEEESRRSFREVKSDGPHSR